MVQGKEPKHFLTIFKGKIMLHQVDLSYIFYFIYLSIVNCSFCLLFIVYCLLFIVYCLLFIVYCLLFIVYCLLFVVCCLLFVVCCLLFVVCIT